MSFVGSNILAGASGQGGAGGYEIERSLRFNAPDSSFLSRTPSSPGNLTTWTMSVWVKNTLGFQSTYPALFGANNYNGKRTFLRYTASSTWEFFGLDNRHETLEVFRDPSAWYHLVLKWDTTNSTAADRVILYINGVRQTWDGTFTANATCGFNANVVNLIGKEGEYARYINAYLADYHFIDGQALAPTDFGETDDNGVWQPKKFEGDYVTSYSGTTTSLSQTGWNPSQSGNIWDGNASSASRATGYAGGTKGTVSFTPPLTNVTKVEIWTQNYVNYLNGVSVSTPENTNGGWHTLYDNSGSPITLNSVGNAYDTNNTQTVDIAGVRINGSIVNSQTWTPPSGVGFVSPSNSFHLDFADNSSNAALGTDTSGNNNTWTVNNLSVAAGAGNDSLRDSPTNGTQPDTGAGGEVVGNYATLNPLAKSSNFVTTNGNLAIGASGGVGACLATIAYPTSGKWYYEIVFDSVPGYNHVGIAREDTALTGNPGYDTTRQWTYWQNGRKTNNVVYAASFAAGDVIGVAFDADAGSLTFYKNGASQGVNATGLTSTTYNYFPYFPCFTNTANINFGQRAFAYPLSGYKSLNTANLPEPTIADGSKYFDTKVWSGTGSSQAITGYDFSPDFAWIKRRNATASHMVFDTIRTATKGLHTDSSQSEFTDTTTLTAFNTDGFTLGGHSYSNASGGTYVGWAWDAGTIGANEVGSYWSPAYNTKYIGFKFPTSSGGRAVFGLESGTGTADIYTSTDNSYWTRVQQNVTLSTTDSTYTSSAQYLIVVNTSDATWGAHHYAMATNGTDGHYSTAAYPGSGSSFTWSGPGYTDWDFRTSGTVIKPGGLNSSVYDQSSAISSNITGNLPASGSNALANWFNGQRANKLEPSGSGSLDFTGVSALQNFSGTLQFAVSAYAADSSMKFVINASSDNLTFTSDTFPNVTGGFPTQLITIPVTSLNTLDFTSVSGRSTQFWGMYLNGKLLVDSTATPDTVPTIASTVRANPSAGFSIVSYTGGAANATVGHGLNAAPAFYIVKRRNGSVGNWQVYHGALGATYYGALNATDAFTTSGGTARWNDTAPTNSVFSIGTSGNVNASGGTYIAYCFAPVEGYSAMGSYTGNGSADGPFVFTGMRPRWILFKSITNTSSWGLFDTERDPHNVSDTTLFPDDPQNEISSTNYQIDILSNGFKIRNTFSRYNTNGNSYIYIAFAEHPFKTARAR